MDLQLVDTGKYSGPCSVDVYISHIRENQMGKKLQN